VQDYPKGQEQDHPSDELAAHIADYLETNVNYESWSKRRCAMEAVRLAVEDAHHETTRVLQAAGYAHVHCDGDPIECAVQALEGEYAEVKRKLDAERGRP
jgi:hypothetical protein